MQSFTIIVFFYNETGNIEKVCREAIDFLSILKDEQKEIIFVDDASTDGTMEKVKTITKGLSYIKFICHPTNLGIGACLKTGYETAQMKNVCAVPGDGQFDINELRAFRNTPDKVVISFFRSNYTGYSFFRKVLTRLNRLVNRILFGFYVRDVNWIKIYKNKDLQTLKLKSKSSFIESEIIYFLTKKCKIISTPSQFLPRAFGSSKSVKVWFFFQVLKDIISLFWIRLCNILR